MKTTTVKLLLFASYLTAVGLVWSLPDLFGGVLALTVKGVLIYCGIIVGAQVLAALVATRSGSLNGLQTFGRRCLTSAGGGLESEAGCPPAKG